MGARTMVGPPGDGLFETLAYFLRGTSGLFICIA